VRLEVQSLARDKTGALVRFNYTGTVSLTGAAGKVLRAEVDAKTTDFGEACEFLLFFPYSKYPWYLLTVTHSYDPRL